MTEEWSTTRTACPALLAVALIACLALAPTADAKKGGGKVDITKVVNTPVPDRAPAAAGGQHGILTSTIQLGKRFKGRRIRDVNVTLQTLGTSGMAPASDLQARVTAPNGANTFLFRFLSSGFMVANPSIGPLTLDDEAALELGDGPPNNPTRLFAPWAGTSAPHGQLWPLDNGPARGTWTLNLYDSSDTETSNLVSWRLTVITGKPFRTK